MLSSVRYTLCHVIDAPLSLKGFPSDSVVKTLPAMQEPQETLAQSLGWEAPLEKDMAIHSSILAGVSHGQSSLIGYSP